MAFILNDLNPIGGQSRAQKRQAAVKGAIGLWSYFHLTDNLAAVKGAGYFNNARDLLTPGDVILFSDDGAAVDIITVALVPAPGSDVTIQATDINSA